MSQLLKGFVQCHEVIGDFRAGDGNVDKIMPGECAAPFDALLSAGVPVITQQWLYEGDDIGHYRVARGYDLSKNIFIYNDSMDRHDKTQVNNDLQDKLWKGYDRRYFPVYTAATARQSASATRKAKCKVPESVHALGHSG